MWNPFREAVALHLLFDFSTAEWKFMLRSVSPLYYLPQPDINMAKHRLEKGGK